jgi:hypothetical protein
MTRVVDQWDYVMGNPKQQAQFKTDAHHNFTVENCMTPVYYTDALTGKKRRKWHRCKDFRECKNCANYRALKELALWKKAGMKNLVMARFDADRLAQAFIRKINDGYRRYPINGEVVLVFRDSERANSGYNYLLDNVLSDKELAFALTQTPKRKAMSGKLVEDDEPEIKETDAAVYVPRVVFDLIAPIEQPTTEAQLQQLLDEQRKAELDLYHQYDIEYTILFNEKQLIKMSEVNWDLRVVSNNNISNRKDSYTSNDGDVSKQELDELNRLLFH